MEHLGISMASRINIYSKLLISRIRILDINYQQLALLI